MDARIVHIQFQLIRLFYLFIWWFETTERLIDSHFVVKDSNVFSVAMGYIILLLLGVALPLLLFVDSIVQSRISDLNMQFIP